MEIISPFSYVFGTEVITEDLSELKTNTCFAHGREQDEHEYKENPFTILNKYKYSKKILTKYLNEFVKENFNKSCQYKITTSWMTKLGVGERVHPHNHRNSMWSGVFYFDEYTEKSCALNFVNPIQKAIPLKLDDYKSNPMTTDISVQPEHNLLVLFPSWITHYSQPNQEKERKCLAFNFMPKNLIGIGDSSYDPSWMR
tara:strand:+ start:4227 stop:4823 length:597 start_codon:yes stop_codon:yes gene_type:complete